MIFKRCMVVFQALILHAVAIGQTADVPDYGFEWAVIGDPGNRATFINEMWRFVAIGGPDNVPELGAVENLYRMAITEVTVGDWLEFVQAYRPFYLEQNGGTIVVDPGFTGNCITAFQVAVIRSHCSPEEPTDMSWEYAARYCNWLHNGKVNELWAFETGAYETETFYIDEGGFYHHQLSRNPTAKFWIPSLDEWIKAAYYDPDRYGSGIPGYWSYPDRSNTRPIGNLPPDAGGERNAGEDDSPLPGSVYPYPVGSFDHVRSPWGLLDCAGGIQEHTEGLGFLPQDYGIRGAWSRAVKGTSFGNYADPVIFGEEEDWFNRDRIEFFDANSVTSSGAGLRLASRLSCPADLAPPFDFIDFGDAMAFVEYFQAGIQAADLADPMGIFDLRDIAAFLVLYNRRCGISE